VPTGSSSPARSIPPQVAWWSPAPPRVPPARPVRGRPPPPAAAVPRHHRNAPAASEPSARERGRS
jgi:hypothetical protein